MGRTTQPPVKMSDRVYHQVKAYANDRNIEISRALGELVAAGLETKNDTALEAFYRAFEGMNRDVCEEWEGVRQMICWDRHQRSRQKTVRCGSQNRMKRTDG